MTIELRRRSLLSALTAAPMMMSMRAAHAQKMAQVDGGYPNQPIHLISPFPPGGGNDFHMRLVSNELAAVVGQPVVAENKAGAGGNIGTQSVARAKPDGYTVLTSQVSIMAVNPTLYRSTGFDPVKDFIPVTQINAAPLALVVTAASPIKTMADLRTQSKAQGGRMTYGTPGNGTLSHLLGVALDKDAGIQLTHVPYRGASQAMADLMGGQVSLMITSTSSVAPMIQQGKLRALGVTSPRRVGVYKNVPTLEEQGFKGMTYDDWYGFFVPAKTPAARVAYLNQAITSVLKMPAIAQKIVDAGSEVVAGTPEQLAAQLKEDTQRWSRVVKISGVTID